MSHRTVSLILSLVCFAVIILCAYSAFADQAELSWQAVTTNTDGTACTDLAGYNVYLHDDAAYAKIGVVSSGVLGYTDSGITVPNNTAVTRCYVVTAFDNDGNESAYSNEACKSFFGADTIAPGKPALSVR
jgi:hypothetical protein